MDEMESRTKDRKTPSERTTGGEKEKERETARKPAISIGHLGGARR